ncbi:unnamed protein product [Lepidochelys kempii]
MDNLLDENPTGFHDIGMQREELGAFWENRELCNPGTMAVRTTRRILTVFYQERPQLISGGADTRLMSKRHIKGRQQQEREKPSTPQRRIRTIRLPLSGVLSSSTVITESWRICRTGRKATSICQPAQSGV